MVHSAGTAENTRILENRESVHKNLAMGVIGKLNKGNWKVGSGKSIMVGYGIHGRWEIWVSEGW